MWYVIVLNDLALDGKLPFRRMTQMHGQGLFSRKMVDSMNVEAWHAPCARSFGRCTCRETNVVPISQRPKTHVGRNHSVTPQLRPHGRTQIEKISCITHDKVLHTRAKSWYEYRKLGSCRAPGELGEYSRLLSAAMRRLSLSRHSYFTPSSEHDGRWHSCVLMPCVQCNIRRSGRRIWTCEWRRAGRIRTVRSTE